MKNLLKPFSYTLIASAIAMAFSQPVFASNIQNNANQQQSRNLNKNKGKPTTNIQQQNKKSTAKIKTNNIKNERSEIERITHEQKIARQKAEEQRKQAEAIATAQEIGRAHV